MPKNNLALPPQGLACWLEQTIVAGNIVVVGRVGDQACHTTANQAMAADAAGEDSRTATAEAEEFLRELLANGPVPQKEVKTAAEGAGLGSPLAITEAQRRRWAIYRIWRLELS